MSGDISKPQGEYWAAVSPDEIEAQIVARYRSYRKLREAGGHIMRWRLAYATMHGRDPLTGNLSELVTEGGEDGELLGAHINMFRRLVMQQITLATGDRPTFKPLANNDSPEALEQCVIAEVLATYEMGGGKLEEIARRSLKIERCFGEAYFVQLWDADGGETLATEEGMAYDETGEPIVDEDGRPMLVPKAVNEGVIVRDAFSPLDVARDLGVKKATDATWHIVRNVVNKWDLAERYPEARAEILEAKSVDSDDTFGFWKTGSGRAAIGGDETDCVHTYTLFHGKTRAMPQGRETLCIEGRMLRDTSLAYETYPVITVLTDEETEEGCGYADSWDLLSPQQALNAVASGVLTTHDAGSTVNWVGTAHMAVKAEDLRPGLRLAKFTPDPMAPSAEPHVMEMPEVKPSSFQLLQLWETTLQTLSGVNGVALGKSEGSSGTDNALLGAQAVQAQGRIQQAYMDLLAAAMSASVELYRAFATEKRTLDIAGSDERTAVRSFHAKQLSEIRRFTVSMAQPALRTFEGRQALADKLLEAFPDQMTPEQYLTITDTGRYQPLYKAARKNVDHLGRENERLRTGQRVTISVADHHELHIREHLAEMCDPDVRDNQPIAKAVYDHIGEHEMLWEELTMQRPGILAATGQRPFPPRAMGMGPMAPPGAPTGGPPPMPGGPKPGPSAPQANVPGAPETVNGVALPKMPTNPQSGQPAGPDGEMR